MLIVHWKYMKSKKARVVKNVIQATVVVGLGYLVRHMVAETHGAMVWVAAGWLLTAWIVLRLAVALKRGYANFRTHTESGVSVDNLDKLTTASMPPWMRGHYAIEKEAYRGAWRTVTARPLAPAGEYSVAGGPNSAKVAAALLLLVAVIAVVAAVFLPVLITGFRPRLLWFAGTGCLLLYAVIWIVGGRRRLREGGHRMTDSELVLDAGMRCSGVVALDEIASCRVTGHRLAEDGELWTVSPGERPNVLIELKSVTAFDITSFGTPHAVSKRRIALYVDQPATFVGAVSRAIAALPHATAA